jgi:hypothetical protein
MESGRKDFRRNFFYDFRENRVGIPVFLFRQKANMREPHAGIPSGNGAQSGAFPVAAKKGADRVLVVALRLYKKQAGCCILPFISRRYLSDTSMAPDPVDAGTQILTNAPDECPLADTGEKKLPVLNIRPSRWNRSS